MNSFATDFAPASNRPGLEPPSTALLVASLVLIAVLENVYGFPLYSLLSSAATWGIVYTACRFLVPSTHPVRRNQSSQLLAGCILAGAICDRAGSGGEKALVSLAYLLLRQLGVGGGGDVAGRWRTAAVIAVGGTVALGSAMKDESDCVLSLCALGFSTAGYVLLEEQLGRREWAQLGRETGLYLAVGFSVAAVVMENLVFEFVPKGWAKLLVEEAGGKGEVAWKVLGSGVLGVAWWGLVPLLVARRGVVAVGFVELATGLGMAAVAGMSGVQAGGAAVAAGGMGWWFVGGHVRTPHMYLLLVASAAVSCFYVWSTFSRLEEYSAAAIGARPEDLYSTSTHPIAKLIQEAESRHVAMVRNQSSTLEEAVHEYKRRYSMPPPPNFDQWYYFAKARNVVLVDEYDIIFHSLKPFWGMPPAEIRKRAREAMGFKDDFQLKNNKLLHAYIRSGGVQVAGQGPEWQKKATKEMLARFVQWLPDMDLPFNIHDEPRVVVPHDEMAQLLKNAEGEMRQLQDLGEGTRNRFTPLNSAGKAIPTDYPTTQFNVFAHQGIWTQSTLSCPPDSPARNISAISTSSTDLSHDITTGNPLGLISNTTSSSDICLYPSLEHRYGFFERPNAFNVVKRLYPVFSQSKISSYADILYPSPWYWADKVPYDPSADPLWSSKSKDLYWRGSTTGGFSRNQGWRNHHRQLAVSALSANGSAPILRLNSETGEWESSTAPRSTLRDKFIDVRFSHVGQCDPADCDAQKKEFTLAPHAAQNDAFQHAFLLDMDGNAFSGRYHAFLKSRSAVFKMALFREWSDDWVVPWVHYVPLSLGMGEAAEVVRFFSEEVEGQELVSRIAEQGRRWAGEVLRREDLEVWVFRLLLEWGRAVDERRGESGFGG